MTSNPAYCSHIFKNIYIEKQANNTATVSACCINRASEPTSVVNFYHNEYLRDQRRQIANGKKIASCNLCWMQEELGTISNRRLHAIGDPYKVELQGVHYNVPPICNAKCIICSSAFSSAWAAEMAKFDDMPAPRLYAEIKQNTTELDLDLSAVNEIYFNGGEPLLSDDMPLMLNKIKQAQGSLQKVTVKFNTNGSISPNQHCLEQWQDAQGLYIFFSIDAVGPAFDYIRYPLLWSDVQQNVLNLAGKNLLTSGKDYHVSMACTVGVHNVLEVVKLQQWIDKNKPSLPWFKGITVQYCHGALGLDHVSAELAQIFDSALPNTYIGNRIRSWLKKCNAADNSVWINYLEKLDQRRNLNWQHALPDLADAIQTISKKV